jgi:hypothetical protein
MTEAEMQARRLELERQCRLLRADAEKTAK